MSIASTGLGHDEMPRGGAGKLQAADGPALEPAKRAYLDQDQASAYLADRGLIIAPNTLGKYRTVGGGPPYRKFGRKPIYAPVDLDAWAEERLGTSRRSTSEAD